MTLYSNVCGQKFTLDFNANSEIGMNMLGLAYMLISDCFIKMSFGQVQQIPMRLPIYQREVQNRMYSPTSYFVSICIGSFLMIWQYPLIMALMTFWIFGFED